MIDAQEYTASAQYGFTRGEAFSNLTAIGVSPTASAVGGPPLDHHALGHRNPMFWLLILVLLFVGYVGFLFDFQIKKIGAFSIKGGSKN